MSEPDLTEVARELVAALDAAQVPYALGGAVALGVWSAPRATLDIDVNVFVDDSAMGRLFDALESLHVPLDRDTARSEAREKGLIVLRLHGYRIDVFLPSIDFSWEAERTRRKISLLGADVWVLSPEALAVFKLLFYRPKDIVDLERLIAVQQRAIDTGYVRSHIVQMMGEQDPRVATWDALVALHGPGS